MLAAPVFVHGQIYQMTDGVINTCNGTFTDSGGLDGDYQPNETITATFCSSGVSTDGTHIQMQFANVDIAAGDMLCFYDGTTVDADSLLSCANDFAVDGANGFLVQATAANTSGCLTIQFISDGTMEGSGWTAVITCTVACQIFQAQVTSPSHEIIPIDTGYIDICQGERVSFSATGIYGQNGIVYQQSDLTSEFFWTFDDGGTAAGPDVTHVFENPYGHIVSVVITDERGCVNSNFVGQRVRVSPTPNFMIGEEIDSLICHGDTITLTGSTDAEAGGDVTVLPGRGDFIERGIVSDSIPLPDGDGNCYETPINFETFSPGQVLESIDDLQSICVNMEHSWMRDLEISVICPDGTEVLLHEHLGHVGSEVHIGEPIDGDFPIQPGLGYTYCWVPDETLPTWNEFYPWETTPGGVTLPAGDYGTEEPLSNLVGCPLNGEWILKICDLWGGDNGYVFFWNINFNPDIYPDVETYSPELVEHQWLQSPLLDYYSQDSIVAIPQNAGAASFNYSVTDAFGCTYDTSVVVEVLPETHPDCHSCGEYVSEPEDATICSGETAYLDISTNTDLTDLVTFSNQPGVSFGFLTNPPSNPLYVGISVNSVAPLTLVDPYAMINSVCINIDGVPTGFLNDLNIYLIAPSGERIELTTGNGGIGDSYVNTCFSPIAFSPITSASAPFTGTFQPEGNWGDLLNADVIGEWQLEISDSFGPNPIELSTLVSWSISFNSTNELNYSWEPTDGTLSCTDCPNPFAVPLSTTAYISTTTDQYGCIHMDTVTVFVVDSIPAPELSCQSIGDGQIQFTWPTVDGINNYDINIFDGGVAQGWQMYGNNNEYIFSGLGFEDEAQLSIRVHTDELSNNCGVMTDTLTCIYTECAAQDSLVVDSIRITDVSCFGLSDGSAEVFLANGHQPITYEWNDAQQQVEQGAFFLSAGQYEVRIRDSIYCQLVVPIEITEPEPLLATVVGTDVLCKGDNTGSGMATGVGGTPPYSYAWDDGTTISSTATLDAGNHFVTITDNNACEYVDTVFIGEPAEALSASYEQTFQGCNGATDNKAMILPSGGTGPTYQYHWDNGSNNALAEHLPAGISFVTVTDENGCQYTLDVELTDLDSLYAGFLVVEPSCHGSSDGILSANIYGGGAGQDGVESDYNFEWSSGHQGVAAVNVPGGMDYYLTLTDHQGCSAVVSRYLDEPNPILFNIAMTEPSCYAANDGKAVVTDVNGTQGDFNVLWGTATGGQTGVEASNLSAGVYSVTVIDDHSCQTVGEITVTEPPILKVDYVTKDNGCFGDAEGSINVSVSGGRPDYVLEWSNNAQGTQQSNLPAGIYTLTVRDKNGCEEIRNIEITQPDPVDATFETDSVSCYGRADGRIRVLTEGGSPPFQFSLDNEHFIGAPTLIGLEAGAYNVFIIDSQGCLFYGDAEVPGPGQFVVDAGPDQTISLGDTIQITANSGNAQGAVEYVWIPPYEGIISCQECATSYFYPQSTAIFELYGIDEKGCESEDLLTINVEKPRLAVVPTGFTPNGDQVNDILLVHGLPGTMVTSFKIFDRWGELVFEAHDFEVNDVNYGWDGTVRGRDVAGGVYIWQLEVEYPYDKETGQFTGETTLIR